MSTLSDSDRRSAAALLQATVAAAMEPAFAIDTSTRLILAVNSRFVELSGTPSDELVGGPCSLLCGGPGAACTDEGCLLLFSTTGQDSPVSLRAGLLAGEIWSVAGRVCHADGAAILLRPPGASRSATNALGHARTAVSYNSSDAAQRTVARYPVVSVRALGGFSVAAIGGEELTPRRPRALSLFKLLLTRQGVPLTESLALQLFWPDASRERGLNGLRVLVHDLRRMLEPDLVDGRQSLFIVRRSHSYLLALDAPIEIDMQSFLRSAADAHMDAAAGRVEDAERHAWAALKTYAGDLFESDDEVAWFADQRRQLRDTRIDVMLLLAKLLVGKGDRHAALEQCRRAAEADILREDVLGLLLVLLARDSGRVVASQHFVEMFAAFKARSGLAPSPETAELVDRIMKAADLDQIERELISSIGDFSELGNVAGQGA